MKNNITNILTEAIGKLAKGGVGMSPDEILGYNIAKAELRAKIPAIQEAIVDEIKKITGEMRTSETDRIINHLTK